jgi:outer membrane lipoprotein-sorting protein
MMMKHSLSIAVPVAMVLAMATGGHAEDASALDLVKRVRAAVPKVPFFAKATLTTDRGTDREFDLSHKEMNGVEISYIEVTAPTELKDNRFLLFDHQEGPDQQYIYVPNKTHRKIQVGPQTRTDRFLQSEFFVGDLTQPDIDAFTYSFVGEKDVGGRHCKLVESVPKSTKDEIYSKSIVAIDPNDLLIVETQLYDQTGKLQKLWTMEKMEKVDGYWTPLVQKMVSVQDNHWSRLTLNEIKYNAKLDDETFNLSYLTR